MNSTIQEILNNEKLDSEILIEYFGKIDEQKISDIIDEIEKKTVKLPHKLSRKIFTISVEMLQNLFHHSSISTDIYNDFEKCIFVISQSDNKQKIKLSSWNLVDHKTLNFLEQKIENLNKVSPNEVRALYKEVLGNKEFSEKGGGGLGIIDIKRKSKLPITFDNINLNKNLYYFNFIVFLENKN